MSRACSHSNSAMHGPTDAAAKFALTPLAAPLAAHRPVCCRATGELHSSHSLLSRRHAQTRPFRPSRQPLQGLASRSLSLWLWRHLNLYLIRHPPATLPQSSKTKIHTSHYYACRNILHHSTPPPTSMSPPIDDVSPTLPLSRPVPLNHTAPAVDMLSSDHSG